MKKNITKKEWIPVWKCPLCTYKYAANPAGDCPKCGYFQVMGNISQVYILLPEEYWHGKIYEID